MRSVLSSMAARKSRNPCACAGTVSALLFAVSAASGQVTLKSSVADGIVNVIPTDLTILEAGEARKDLACTVTPAKAQLGFDLKFHGGYDVTVPLHDIAGSENVLTIVFRVTPAARPNEAVYFEQHVHVPYVEEDATGNATLQGSFDLGEAIITSRGSCATAPNASVPSSGTRRPSCCRKIARFR